MLVQSEITAGLLGRKHKPGSFTAGDISAQCGANVIMPPDSDRPSVAESDEEYLLVSISLLFWYTLLLLCSAGS